MDAVPPQATLIAIVVLAVAVVADLVLEEHPLAVISTATTMRTASLVLFMWRILAREKFSVQRGAPLGRGPV